MRPIAFLFALLLVVAPAEAQVFFQGSGGGAGGGGSGTVTNTGTLASGHVTVGNGSTDISTADALTWVSPTLTIGTGSTATGILDLLNATNNNVLALKSGVTTGSYTLTLPVAVAGAANSPIISSTGGVLSYGTLSGNTSKFVTTTGTLTSGNCAQWDANGNLVQASGACGTGGAGTVTVVGAGSLTSTAIVTGGGTTTIQTPSATATLDASGNLSTPGSVTTGAGGSTTGSVALSGGTSGTVTVQPQASFTSYNFNLPTTAGSAGQPLLSAGGGSSAMTWGSAAFKTRGLVFTLGDPAGSALTAGTDYLTVPFACTISAYNLAIDAADATFRVKFWKVATGTAIPTAGNSISTSGVGVPSATAVHSTTVTDFTTLSVAANDIIAMDLATANTIKYVTATLQCDM